MKNALFALLLLASITSCRSEKPNLKTICNPVDLSYRFCLDKPSRRESADPTMIRFKDTYYLFASKSGGYYCSKDMEKWDFIATNQIPVEEYAPTAVAIGDTIYYVASSESKSTLYKTADPMSGKWTVAVEALDMPVWDPAFFLDDDGRLYLYWGCSNVNPLYGVEVDYKNNFKFIGQRKEMLKSDRKKYGWEVPGDYNTNDSNAPWIEGSWVTKVNGKYYLQYAGPGTEFKSYSDGVYVSENPLGPFKMQESNPFASKPEGFVAGGGHGSSLEDAFGNRWQIGAVSISKKHMFERRLALFPVFLDAAGSLNANTKYGDYPMYLPKSKVKSFDEIFTGWMLLSYDKPVTVSSTLDTFPAHFMTDEDIRTYWAAKTGNAGENAVLNLGQKSDVYAIQLNFAEEQTTVYGRQKNVHPRYVVELSSDGKTWTKVIDQSKNELDNSHPYFQLDKPVSCTHVKVTNVEVASGVFALSGLRVFGKGTGSKPALVSKLTVSRNPNDKRKVNLSWDKSSNATGYVVSYGIAKDKLYQHYMVYKNNSVTINSLNATQPYFFTIEAFNENGITPTKTVEAAE